MTDNNAISLPQPSALRPQGWEVEVEVISTDLNDEQRALVIQVKQLSAVVHMAGLERAKRFRLLRESFPKVPPGSKGDDAARPGWADFLRREFDADVRHVNYEIAAIEAGSEKLDETASSPAHSLILQKIGSSHLSEIGVGATPAIRRKIWDKLLDGKLPLTKRTIRAEVKRLNSDTGKTTLQVQRPKSPSKGVATPVLPTGSVARADNRAIKQVSIAKHGNLVPRGDDGRPDPSKPPLRQTELAYLRGTDTANSSMSEKLTAALKTSRCGKVARIRALAAALHREFKALGDRYHGAWDSDRDYPSYMHLWQQLWNDEEGYALHDELEAVRSDISEANRYFEMALMHLYTEGLEVTQ